MNLISIVENKHLKNIPAVKSGDTVKVHQKVKEGAKERIQIFEGVVIRHKGGNGVQSTITVRKIASGVGVERIYPLHSPNIVKIEVTRRSKVRRAYLGYLRALRGKAARMKEIKFDKLAVNVEERELKQEELVQPEIEEEGISKKEEDNTEEMETAKEEVKEEPEKTEEIKEEAAAEEEKTPKEQKVTKKTE